MRQHDSDRSIITAGTLPSGGANCYSTHPHGLQYCHAYSTMHTYVIQSTGEKLLLIRNPWARNYYNGEWKWGSSKWTAEAKNVVNYDSIEKEGGFFFMSYDEYYVGFSLTSVNLDTSSMHQDYFLMFDDP